MKNDHATKIAVRLKVSLRTLGVDKDNREHWNKLRADIRYNLRHKLPNRLKLVTDHDCEVSFVDEESGSIIEMFVISILVVREIRDFYEDFKFLKMIIEDIVIASLNKAQDYLIDVDLHSINSPHNSDKSSQTNNGESRNEKSIQIILSAIACLVIIFAVAVFLPFILNKQFPYADSSLNWRDLHRLEDRIEARMDKFEQALKLVGEKQISLKPTLPPKVLVPSIDSNKKS